jgi:hypothetical protein
MKQPNCPVKNLCRSINAKGLLFAFIVFILTIAFATNDTSSADYFVSTAGSDSNDGSAAHPWRTIQHASSLVTAGYTVHVAPGTYNVAGPGTYPAQVTNAITTSASGTASARIRFISDVKWGAKIVTSNRSFYSWGVNGNYVDIVGFDITGDSMGGIRLNGSNQRALNNLVHDLGFLFCDGNGGAGIESNDYTASNNDIIGNVVHDIGTPGGCQMVHGIYHSINGGYVQNNIVYRASSYGIHLWHAATNVVISNNTVFANGSASSGGGILIGDGDSPGDVVNDNTVVTNNIIYANPKAGLREFCYSGQTCIGNNNIYTNNLIYHNGTDVSLLFGHTASNTISADPQFVKYQADGSGDYHLQSTSPAIDKGTYLGAPLNDFDGGARPVGATWDIGAYEAGATTKTWPWQ